MAIAALRIKLRDWVPMPRTRALAIRRYCAAMRLVEGGALPAEAHEMIQWGLRHQLTFDLIGILSFARSNIMRELQ